MAYLQLKKIITTCFLMGCSCTLGVKGQDIRSLLVRSDSFYYLKPLSLFNFQKALALAKNASAIALKDSGEHSAIYAEIVGQFYGMNYEALGEADSAEYYYLKGIEIYRKLGLRHDTLYASTLVNLGNLYSSPSFRKPYAAKPYFDEAMPIIEKYMTPRNSDYAAALNNIGLNYVDLGEYSIAEPYFAKSLDLMEQYHPQVVDTILYVSTNLAELYKRIGAFSKAYELINAALLKLKPGDPVDIKPLLNGYMLLTQLSIYLKKQISIDSINKRMKELKPDNLYANMVEAAIATNNINWAVFNNKSDDALRLFKTFSEKKITSHLIGGKTAIVDVTLALIDALIQVDSLDKAAEFMDSLYQSNNKLYNSNSNVQLDWLLQMAYIKLLQKNYLSTEKLLLQLNLLIQDTATFYLYHLPEEQQWAYASKIRHCAGFVAYYLNQTRSKNGQLIELLFNNYLLYKGIVLRRKSAIKNQVKQKGDSAYMNLYTQWQDAARKEAIEMNNTTVKNPATKIKIGQQVEQLERQLLDNLPELKDIVKPVRQWQELQHYLLAGETLVLFTANANFQNIYNLTASGEYGMLLLSHGSRRPFFIPLSSEAKIEALLAACNLKDVRSIGNLARMGQVVLAGKKVNPLQEFYKLVWQKAIPYLKKTKKIFYIPNGILGILPLEAAMDEHSQYMRNKYKMELIFDFNALINRVKTDKVNKPTVEIWGDIDYENTADLPNVGLRSRRVDALPNSPCSTLTPLGNLEINMVQKILAGSGFSTVQYRGSKASEMLFTKMPNRGGIIHLSTHGFYNPGIENYDKEILLKKGLGQFGGPLMSQMLQSGIAMAGANYVWPCYISGNSSGLGNNGLLYSYEIKDLDLSNVELVVLSACETGLGRIAYDEGILGFQQALKMAGAKKIIYTLWRVLAKDTKVWMGAFYTHYAKMLDVEAAFDATQKQMSKKMAPYSWAGFVLAK